MRRSYTTIPVEVRFWSKVDRSGGPDACWPWTGSITTSGYGQLNAGDRRPAYAHRLAYEFTVGPIPPGFYICHHCDNRSCANPSHLFLGTPTDNVRDAREKGRLATGERQGSYTHPETRERGDKHWSRRMPERHARGSAWHAAKLTEDDVREVRRRAADGETPASLGRAYGMNEGSMRDIIRRRTWRHVE